MTKRRNKRHGASRKESEDKAQDEMTAGTYIDRRFHDAPKPKRKRNRKKKPQLRQEQDPLPLTNHNLQNLLNQPGKYAERQYGSVVLDMDKYADEQRKLARSNSGLTDMSPISDEDDASVNSLEFGGSNPSSEHLSDTTSLDDVCFPDYYDELGAGQYKDRFEWPDLKVLEEYVKQEMEEVEEDTEEQQVSFSTSVFQREGKGKGARPTRDGWRDSRDSSEGDLRDGPRDYYPRDTDGGVSPRGARANGHGLEDGSNEESPLLSNYQINEVESIGEGLFSESLRVRPTPIQPWEKSREQIPTILKSSLHKKRGDTCRFTYFREDLDKTVHAATISGLIGEKEKEFGDDNENSGYKRKGQNDQGKSDQGRGEQGRSGDLGKSEQGKSGKSGITDDSPDNEDIYSKLQKLFQPYKYSSLSRTPSMRSVSDALADSGVSGLQPMTRLKSEAVSAATSAVPGGETQNDISDGAGITPFWLDVLDPTEEEMKVLSKTFGIHPLTTEDIFLGETREKVELFKSYYFICFTSFDIVYERRKQRAKEQERKLNKLQEMYENGTGDDTHSVFGGGERKSGLWGMLRGLVGGRKSSLSRHNTQNSFVHSRGSSSVSSHRKKIREGELQPLNMYMIVFKHAVITFHFSPTPHPINVRRRARLLRDYLTVSSDWMCYALVDDITDSFAPMIASIEEEVNLIEDAILKMHSGDLDTDELDELDDEEEPIEEVRAKSSGRGSVRSRDAQNVFFRRSRSKSTVEQAGVTGFLKSNSVRSGSRKSSKLSKSTASKIISWRRKGDMLRRIGECRKRVMSILRLLGTKADVIKAFSKRFSEGMYENNRALKSEIAMYLGDIQDHIVTMVQSLNHYEKLLARFHSNYLAQINIDMTKVNNDTNDVLGKITILGTIVLPINVVTGLWGMNCIVPGQEHEGLTWFYGIVLSMFVFSIVAYNYARRVTGL